MAAPTHFSSGVDIDAGAILEGRVSLDEVGRQIRDRVLATAGGWRQASEAMGRAGMPAGIGPALIRPRGAAAARPSARRATARWRW
jgi:hypothetical protein